MMGAAGRIIGRHLLPGFMSHPDRLGHALHPVDDPGRDGSPFLGLGLRPPITSWGVLLNEGDRHQRGGGQLVALMFPVVLVILVIPPISSWATVRATPPIPTPEGDHLGWTAGVPLSSRSGWDAVGPTTPPPV